MAPPVQPAAPSPAILAPVPLEQRLYDLLLPYRNECFSKEDVPAPLERKTLVLCANIAMLIRHSQFSFGKYIQPSDVSIAAKNWDGLAAGNETAYVGVFVNGISFTHTFLSVLVKPGENVVEAIAREAEKRLNEFLPGL